MKRRASRLISRLDMDRTEPDYALGLCLGYCAAGTKRHSV